MLINYHEAIRRLKGENILLSFTKDEMLELELARSTVAVYPRTECCCENSGVTLGQRSKVAGVGSGSRGFPQLG